MTAFSLGDPQVRPRFDVLADLYVPPAEKEMEGAGIFGVGRAAFEIFNTVGSTGILLASMADSGNEPEQIYNVYERQDPTKPWNMDTNPYLHLRGYEMFFDRFRRVITRRQGDRIKRRIDRELDNRRILFEERPIVGAGASLAMGILDPLFFWPAAKVAVGVRGVSTIRTAGRFAAQGAGIVGAQEAILHQQQLAKPPEEIAIAIGATAILGGMIGAAVGRMTAKQLATAERQIIMAMGKEDPKTPVTFIGMQEQVAGKPSLPLVNLQVPAGGKPAGTTAVFDPKQHFIAGTQPGVTLPESLRLAAERERFEGVEVMAGGPNTIPVTKGRLGSYADLEKASQVKIAKGSRTLARLWKHMAPRTANYASESNVTRGVANRLHASNLLLEGTKELDAETVVDLIRNQLRNTERKIDKLHATYRRDTADALPQENWLAEVAKAMRGESGVDGKIIRVGEHPIESVRQAAKIYRDEVFTPLAQKAVDMGIMPKEIFERPGYLMRLYNGERLRQPGEADKFVDAVVGFRVKQAIAKDPTANISKVSDKATKEARGVMNTLLRTPEGRLFPGDIPLRGPLLERTFDIPDEVIAPWLSSNMDRIAKHYIRAMASDLAIAEHFGLQRFRPMFDTTQGSVVDTMRKAAGKAADPKKAARAASKILATRDKEIADAVKSPLITGILKKGSEKRKIVGRPTLAKKIINADTNTDAVKLLKERDDLLITEFSTGNMDIALDQIRSNYNQRIRAVEKTDKAEALRLKGLRDFDLKNTRHMRDEIRGMLQMPADPTTLSGKAARGLRLARQFTLMSTGGLIALSQVPDQSLQLAEFGLTRVFRSSFLPLVTDLNRVKITLREARMAFGPSEIATGRRSLRLFDLEDEFATNTAFERGVNKLTYYFSLVNLMTPMNAGIRTTTTLSTNAMVIETALKVKAGRIVSRADKADLKRVLEVVRDEKMLRRIADQFEAHGDRRSTFAPNTTAWTDPGAITAMQAALKRVDDFVLIKGGAGDRPRVGPGLAQEIMRTLMFFRNFGLSSMTRVLGRSLQYRDARIMSGFISSIGLAMIAIKLRDVVRGQDRERTPLQWAGRAWERSAFSGFIFDGDDVLDTFSGGNVSISRLFGTRGESRYFSPRDVYSAVLGPIAGQASDLATGLGGFADLDPTPGDVDRLRRLIPLQNHFALIQIFDQLGEDPLRRAVQ